MKKSLSKTRPHLQKPLCRASHFTSTLLSLFCLSTCISIPSPQPSPHASWWACSYLLVARRRTWSPGCHMQCVWHSASDTCSPGAASSHGPSCLTLSNMNEGGLVPWPGFAHCMTTCSSWQKSCLQDKIQASGKAAERHCWKREGGCG